MKNKSNTKWLACDCETDAFDGHQVRPFVWALQTSDGGRLLTYDTAELVAYLQNFDGIAYAHNGGKFDWLMPGVIEHLERGEIMLINGRLAKARMGKCELRDSLLIIPSALEKGGDKMKFDYSILHRDKKNLRGCHRRLIEQYLMMDVTALYRLVERFRSRHGDALTQAGAALAAWENMGGSKRRYGPGHDAFFRQFYSGGRCEVFQYGAPLPGTFVYCDIKSSYPRAMMESHPLGTEYKTSTDYINAPGASFWAVTALSRGAFPYLTKDGLFFPDDGEIRAYKITGWELRAALETGTADVVSALGYIPRFTESLRPYVEKFYAEKLDAEIRGDKIDRLLAKIFLNSLYGKYGANPKNYMDFLLVDPGVRVKTYSPDYEGDGYEVLSRPSSNAQYFDVALAASITGYARAALWRALRVSEGIAYCDTDSIVAGACNVKIGADIGDWEKIAVLDSLHIAGKKLYCGRIKFKFDQSAPGFNNHKKPRVLYRWMSAHKGFSKLDTNAGDIVKAAKGEIVEIRRSAPTINISGSQTFIKRKMRLTQKRG